MKNKGKVLVLMLSAAALVAASVFGTMAYLTDNESVTNTFTVGQVGLDLDEAPVDANGDATTGTRVKRNEYHLLPGHEYDKDPTVHIDENSESCWVFVKVTNEISEIEWNDDANYVNVATQIANNGWTPLKDDSENPVANVYYRLWTKDTDSHDLFIFSNFKIDGADVVNVPDGETAPDGKFDLSAYDDKEIVVTAYAVQLDGFENKPYSAWTAADFEN